MGAGGAAVLLLLLLPLGRHKGRTDRSVVCSVAISQVHELRGRSHCSYWESRQAAECTFPGSLQGLGKTLKERKGHGKYMVLLGDFRSCAAIWPLREGSQAAHEERGVSGGPLVADPFSVANWLPGSLSCALGPLETPGRSRKEEALAPFPVLSLLLLAGILTSLDGRGGSQAGGGGGICLRIHS